ncbi:MAG: hypothetical protein JKX70_08440 [Phycisphaerales bacterium]|nr:hypothetical protein [Phycisphaerales bacterium]
MRTLTILILLLAGLPRVDIGMFDSSAGHDCTEMVCQQPVITPSGCCEEPAPVVDMDEYCPMSGGECRCGVTPDDDRTPTPKAPFQRSDTHFTLGLFDSSAEVPRLDTSADIEHGVATDLFDGLASLRTHNETQALLGIWQT